MYGDDRYQVRVLRDAQRALRYAAVTEPQMIYRGYHLRRKDFHPGLHMRMHRALDRGSPDSALGEHLLDYLAGKDNYGKGFYYNPWEGVQYQGQSPSLGPWWTTNRQAAEQFANGVMSYTYDDQGNRQENDENDPDDLGIVLSAQWNGQGRDEKNWWGTDAEDYPEEHELSLLPGAPVTVTSAHVIRRPWFGKSEPLELLTQSSPRTARHA